MTIRGKSYANEELSNPSMKGIIRKGKSFEGVCPYKKVGGNGRNRPRTRTSNPEDSLRWLSLFRKRRLLSLSYSRSSPSSFLRGTTRPNDILFAAYHWFDGPSHLGNKINLCHGLWSNYNPIVNFPRCDSSVYENVPSRICFVLSETQRFSQVSFAERISFVQVSI